MISKELLSEVLAIVCVNIREVYDNEIIYTSYELPRIQDWKSINIHELAHKCKEWAWSYKYLLESGVTETPFCSITNTNEDDELGMAFPDERLLADSEPEAVFDACQWVLNNKQVVND
jgi:hypothetical protein